MARRTTLCPVSENLSVIEPRSITVIHSNLDASSNRGLFSQLCLVVRLSQLIGIIIRLYSTDIFPYPRGNFDGSNASVSKLSKHYLHVKRLIFNTCMFLERVRWEARELPEKGLFQK